MLAPSMGMASFGFFRVVGSATGRRSATSAAASSVCPAAASCATVSSRLCTPPRPLRSVLTARCGCLRRIRPTRLVRTCPGPTSTKVWMPSARMPSMSSTKRTGRAIWPLNPLRTASASAGYGAASALLQQLVVGADTAHPARNSAKGPAAPATTGEWKAVATLMPWAGMPASMSTATAASTAATGPEMTVWRGELWFAKTTSG